jgi:hypothetical protein
MVEDFVVMPRAAVDGINTFRVSAARFARFRVVSRSHFPRFRSSGGFWERVRFPAPPLKEPQLSGPSLFLEMPCINIPSTLAT